MNNVNNQLAIEQADYIVLKIDYNSKIILPFIEGMEYLRIQSMGILIKEEYNKPMKLLKEEADIQIKFMSATALKEMMLSSRLDPEEAED